MLCARYLDVALPWGDKGFVVLADQCLGRDPVIRSDDRHIGDLQFGDFPLRIEFDDPRQDVLPLAPPSRVRDPLAWTDVGKSAGFGEGVVRRSEIGEPTHLGRVFLQDVADAVVLQPLPLLLDGGEIDHRSAIDGGGEIGRESGQGGNRPLVVLAARKRQEVLVRDQVARPPVDGLANRRDAKYLSGGFVRDFQRKDGTERVADKIEFFPAEFREQVVYQRGRVLRHLRQGRAFPVFVGLSHAARFDMHDDEIPLEFVAEFQGKRDKTFSWSAGKEQKKWLVPLVASNEQVLRGTPYRHGIRLDNAIAAYQVVLVVAPRLCCSDDQDNQQDHRDGHCDCYLG